MGFAVAFHHMGRFERNRGLKYVGGEIHVVKGIDPDFLSFFEALGIVKDFKYAGHVKLWWKGSKEKLLNNLRLLSDDKEALALAKYAEDRNEEVDIYVQHIPCQPEVVHFIAGAEMDEEFGQPKVGGEQDVVPNPVVVDEAPEVVEVDVDREVSLVSEAPVGVEAEVICEAEVIGEAKVMGQADVVTEVEMKGETHMDPEAELGGVAERVVEAELRGEEDVICEEVESENDEGAAAEKLDDSKE